MATENAEPHPQGIILTELPPRNPQPLSGSDSFEFEDEVFTKPRVGMPVQPWWRFWAV